MIFQKQLKKSIDNIIKLSHKKRKFSGFTIGNTTKIDNKNYFFTPIRDTEKIIFTGIVLYSEHLAKIVAKYIDGKVDYVLVDAEKKISPKINRRKNYWEPANIERRVREVIKISKLWIYKGNDLAVDAVDILITFLTKNDIRGIGGKKITIIGAGNIGSKLALYLVERGGKVFLTRRNKTKLKQIVKTINTIKPNYTYERVHAVQNNYEASKSADVLIGCTNGVPIITKKMIKSLNENAIIIDVGKGTVSRDAVLFAEKNNIPIYRVDITAAFEGFIKKSFMIEKMIKKTIGKKIISGEKIVSGGLLANLDDIVVDDINKPKFIYGISNGKGDFIRNLNKKQKNKIKKISKLLF